MPLPTLINLFWPVDALRRRGCQSSMGLTVAGLKVACPLGDVETVSIFVRPPPHFWPREVASLPDKEKAQRWRYWGSAMVIETSSVLALGTFVMHTLTRKRRRRNYGALATRDRTTDRLTIKVSSLVLMHIGISTGMTLWSGRTDRLSKRVGLDWEGYFTMMTLGNLWCLAQAVYLFHTAPGAKYPLVAFPIAVMSTVVPVTSDAVDTFKDTQLAALCIQSEFSVVFWTGVIALLYIPVFHVYLLRDDAFTAEFANTYLAVAHALPEDSEAVTLIEPDSSKSEPVAKLMPFIVVMYKQTTPEKRKALMVEAFPQAIVALVYSVFEGASAVAVVSGFVLPAAQLACARIFHRPLRSRVAGWAVKQFAASVQNEDVGRISSLSQAFIADEGALLAEVTAQYQLKEILLHALKSEAVELRSLMEALIELYECESGVNKTVQVIYLDDNHIGDSGAAAVAKALEVNKTMREIYLNLRDNQIGPSGAAALAKALEVNKTVQELHLGNNQIGDTGATALAKALKVNKTVQELHLGNNQIRDSGAAALAKALEVNKTVQVISLRNNQIGDSGYAALAKALTVHKCTVISLENSRSGALAHWSEGD